MSDLIRQLLDAPRGDESKVQAWLFGGRFSGDGASIVPPLPDLLAVVPCDGSCAVAEFNSGRPGRNCGQATHWHDVSRGDELGDVPAHAAYYVLAHVVPAPSGMRRARYVSVGHERPTRIEQRAAINTFEARLRAVEARHTQRRGGKAA